MPSGETTILLTEGFVPIEDSLVIEGPSADSRVTIDANGTQAFYSASTDGLSTIDVSISNVNITGGDSYDGIETDNGGAIAARRTHLTLTNVALTGNQSVNKGGAVWLSRDAGEGSLTLSLVDATNNSADTVGGAISIENIPLTVTRSKFSGNEAISGGAIEIEKWASTLETFDYFFENSNFTDNEATEGRGGAIRYDNDSNFEIQRVWFEGNTAAEGGGAVAVGRDSGGGDLDGALRTNVIVRGSTFKDNVSYDVGGGMAIESDHAETIEITGLQFGTVTIPTLFEGNIAHGTSRLKSNPIVGFFTPRQAAGGGLFVNTTNSEVELSNVDAIGNTTTDHGESTVFGGREFAAKYNDGDGGGLVVNVTSNPTDPNATSNGGNIRVSRLRAIDNVAAGSGGGALLMASRTQTIESYQSTIHVADSTFEGNCLGDRHSNGGCVPGSDDLSPGDGGGLYGFVADEDDNSPPSYISILRSTFNDNHASRHGGGAMLCAKRDGAAEVGNSTFSGNYADAEGGGLALAAAAGEEEFDVWLLHTTITDNLAERGGGLVVNPFELDGDSDEPVHGGIDVTMHNSIVSDNDATLDDPTDPLLAFDDIFVGNIENPDLVTDDVLNASSAGNLVGDAAPYDAGLSSLTNQLGVDDPHAIATGGLRWPYADALAEAG